MKNLKIYDSKKLFSFRYLNFENKDEYLNTKKVILSEEYQYFLKFINDDEENYYLNRVAYDIYLNSNIQTHHIYSFYGFVTTDNTQFIQQAKIKIRKLKIEKIYE
jgi:hypothetical protein